MAEIPEIPEDVCQRVSGILNDDTTAAAVASGSAAPRAAEEVPGIRDESQAAAAVSSSAVTAILESATTTAIRASKVEEKEISATQAASTASVAAASNIPSLPSLESDSEGPFGSTKASDCHEDHGDDGNIENDTHSTSEPELKVKRQCRPALQQLTADDATLDAADKDEKSLRQSGPPVYADAASSSDAEAKTLPKKVRKVGNDEDDGRMDNESKVKQDSVERGREKGAKGGHDEAEGTTPKSPEDEEGRLVLSSGPEDGASVRISGRREGATIEVVEQSRPHYQLVFSVTVPERSLQPVDLRGDPHKRGRDHLSYNENEEKQCTAAMLTNGDSSSVAVQLSLGKKEIKASLESWVRSSDFTAARKSSKVASQPPSGRTDGANHTEKSSRPPSATSADDSLRRWINTGCVPRRAHLLSWLMERLEIVEVATADGGKSDIVREDQQQGRLVVKEDNAKWSLVISKDSHYTDTDMSKSNRGSGFRGDKHVNAVTTSVEEIFSRRNSNNNRGGGGGKPQVRCAERYSRDWSDVAPPLNKTFPGATASSTVPENVYSEQTERGGRGGGDQQQWLWWDSRNPWSRDSRSSTTSSKPSSDGSSCESAPPPPGYQERAPPPPYQEVFGGPSSLRSSAQRRAFERHTIGYSPGHALSNTASGDETGATAAGGPGRLSSPPNEEQQHRLLRRDASSPSYGRFHGDGHPASAGPHAHRDIDIGLGDSAKSHAAERWAQRGDPNRSVTGDDHQPRWEQDRRRRRHAYGDGGSYEGRMFDREATRRPETTVNDDNGEPGGTSWERRPRYRASGRKRSPMAMGSSRPWTTSPQPQGKNVRTDPLPSDRDSWDEERWRLTRHLEACKRELSEAEEGRRRAEAAANAAERSAWATKQEGDGDAVKRARAKAANQKVLDLMQVTERVRLEEQKRRVAAARASNQAARCKQPFRERRGRSQKGAFIGPSVPPAYISAEAPRVKQRVEGAAGKDFYWDEHGRRYARRGRGVDNAVETRESTPGEVGVAIDTVRKLAAACLEEGADFGQPFKDMDADGDGRLTLAELGAALRRAGARLSLSQVTALFRHFDEGLGLDTVGRGDFLWEFCNSNSLLQQWRKAGDVRGGHRGRTAPFRNRARRARYGASENEEGMLSRHDFQRALVELGIHVNGWEADALLDRFTVDDGNENKVDWLAFVDVMQSAEAREDGHHKTNTPASTSVTRRDEREQARTIQNTLAHRGKSDTGFRHRSHWATRGHESGGGLFDGGGTWDRTNRTRGTTTRTSTRDDSHNQTYSYWASSVSPSTAGRYDRGSSIENEKSGMKTRAGAPDGKSSWEMMTAGSSPGALRLREEGGRYGGRYGGLGERMGGRVVENAAEASRLLDELLDDQQELEAFLEEEMSKREREAGKMGISRRQLAGQTNGGGG